MKEDKPPEFMRIEDAPPRIRRAHLRRERRNSALAVLVLLCLGGLLGWALYRVTG